MLFRSSGTTAETGAVGYTPTKSTILLRHIRVINTTAGALAVSLFKGVAATAAAGTEFAFSATVVPANSYLDWNGLLRLDSGSVLCGGSTTTGLTIEGEGEIGMA